MRKLTLTLSFLIVWLFCFSQLKYPAGFKFSEGGMPGGRDASYEFGPYVFTGDAPFNGYDGKKDSSSIMKFLSTNYGIPFSTTTDNLYIGQGYNFERFRYIVVAQDIAIQLSSKKKDLKFDSYSKWLLFAIRDQIEKKKTLNFP